MDKNKRIDLIREKTELIRVKKTVGALKGIEILGINQYSYLNQTTHLWQLEVCSELKRYECHFEPKMIFPLKGDRRKLIQQGSGFLSGNSGGHYFLVLFPYFVEVKIIDWIDFYRTYIDEMHVMDLTLFTENGQSVIDISVEETTLEIYVIEKEANDRSKLENSKEENE